MLFRSAIRTIKTLLYDKEHVLQFVDVCRRPALTNYIKDLQCMLDTCFSELCWLDMSVNIKKSQWIRIGPLFKAIKCNVCMGHNVILYSEEIKYLGIVIKSGPVFKCDLHTTKLKFFKSLNGILRTMGTFTNAHLCLSIISTFCYPTLFYGLVAI